ncbi:hypothetical protein QYE76_027062 [Lolium multiflorum]|uniref:Retrotransposon gag domain-containing protein n=1 Tax=Lolium multiflorum TaxID=4521 RepID=A0AAD8QG92_LOLMU|nr:hypothetical protein QYE76_027062 [Lolium multiflorum]
MPKFQGEEDPKAYLPWVRKVDKIFRIHNYSDAKKVAMASLEFEDYASVWWDEVNKKREKEDLAPIDTWEEMKEVMHTRFVPSHHKREPLQHHLHFESMSDTPSSMDDETPIMEKMYMVHEDDAITPCLLEDEHGGHMEPTTSTTPTSYERDYKGTYMGVDDAMIPLVDMKIDECMHDLDDTNAMYTEDKVNLD